MVALLTRYCVFPFQNGQSWHCDLSDDAVCRCLCYFLILRLCTGICELMCQVPGKRCHACTVKHRDTGVLSDLIWWCFQDTLHAVNLAVSHAKRMMCFSSPFLFNITVQMIYNDDFYRRASVAVDYTARCFNSVQHLNHCGIGFKYWSSTFLRMGSTKHCCFKQDVYWVYELRLPIAKYSAVAFWVGCNSWIPSNGTFILTIRYCLYVCS